MRLLLIPISILIMNQYSLSMIKQNLTFAVIDKQGINKVDAHNVDKQLQSLSCDQFKRFIQTGGKLRLVQLSDGNYKIRYYVDGKGGGPFLGVFLTIGTVVVGAAATLTATVASIPAVGPGCVFVLASGAAATAKAATLVAIATTLAPTP